MRAIVSRDTIRIYLGNHTYLLNQPRRLKASVTQDNKNTNESSTVHTGEVNFFSEVGKVWWDPNGPIRALHSFNKLRVPFILNGFTSQNNDYGNMKLLDIGCGGGILTEALVRSGFKVTGLDASKELIDIAQQHSQIETSLKNKPSYICSTIEAHVEEYSNYYDGVVASEVIEHVNNKDLFMKACIQAVKPGGRIFLTGPNKTLLARIIYLWIAEYILHTIPKGTHSYDMLISTDELKILLEKLNCDIEASKGCLYNIPKNTWHSTGTSQQFFYMLQAVKRL